MKKRTVLVSLFATFILVSIAWVTPVQANESDISDNINEIAKNISEDEDFLNLIKDSDVLSLADMVNVEIRDDEFRDDVEALVNTIMSKLEFKNLETKYGKDIDSLIQKIPEKNIDEIPDAPDDIYYKIFQEGDRINIIKGKNANLNGDGIVVSSSDDAVYINGYECGGLIQKLLDFLYWLSWNLYVTGISFVLVAWVSLIASIVVWTFEGDWNYILGGILFDLSALSYITGLFIMLVACIPAAIFDIILVLQWFGSIIKNKSKTKESPTKIPLLLKEKLTRFFEKILRHHQNLYKIIHPVSSGTLV